MKVCFRLLLYRYAAEYDDACLSIEKALFLFLAYHFFPRCLPRPQWAACFYDWPLHRSYVRKTSVNLTAPSGRGTTAHAVLIFAQIFVRLETLFASLFLISDAKLKQTFY